MWFSKDETVENHRQGLNWSVNLSLPWVKCPSCWSAWFCYFCNTNIYQVLNPPKTIHMFVQNTCVYHAVRCRHVSWQNLGLEHVLCTSVTGTSHDGMGYSPTHLSGPGDNHDVIEYIPVIGKWDHDRSIANYMRFEQPRPNVVSVNV